MKKCFLLKCTILVVALSLITSCSYIHDVVTVTFEPNNGDPVWTVGLESGGSVKQPNNPLREGYVFEGWYLEDTKYDFSKKVVNDITLKALWGAEKDIEGDYIVLNKTQNIKYKTLLSAVNESKENNTILLLSDCTTPNLGDWTEYNFADGCTFDLNGKILTNNVNDPGKTPAGVDGQSVYQGKNITVQNGTIKGAGNYVFFIGNDTKETSFSLNNIKTVGGINCYVAKVILQEGNYFDASTSQYYAVYGDEATQIVIEDGEYIGGTSGISVMQFNYEGNTTEIKNGIFTGKISSFTNGNSTGNAVIKITGGTFNFDPTLYVLRGYTATEKGGVWSVTKNN